MMRLLVTLIMVSFMTLSSLTHTGAAAAAAAAMPLSAPGACGEGCRWAGAFTPEQLLNNATARAAFIDSIMYWEGQFHQNNIGVSMPSGLTLDGHRIEVHTGI